MKLRCFNRNVTVLSNLKFFSMVLIIIMATSIFSTQSNGAFKDYKLDCKIVEEGTKYYSMECCETAKRTENGEEVPFGCTLYSCEKGGECIAEDREGSFDSPLPIDDDMRIPPAQEETNFNEPEEDTSDKIPLNRNDDSRQLPSESLSAVQK